MSVARLISHLFASADTPLLMKYCCHGDCGDVIDDSFFMLAAMWMRRLDGEVKRSRKLFSSLITCNKD